MVFWLIRNLKPSISSHWKPHTRCCMRRLKCFVLEHSVYKTKHLRRLVRVLVRGLNDWNIGLAKNPEFWKIKLEKSSSTNWIFSLQNSISNLIFAGYTGSKNPVRNRQKIQFVKLDFSKLIFQKSNTDQWERGNGCFWNFCPKSIWDKSHF
jgi:hypothetical protein